MFRFKRVLSFLTVLAFFSLAACFQVETTVKIKPDGSGQIIEKVLFSDSFLQMMAGMKAMGSAAQNDPENQPDPDEMTRELVDEMIKEDKIKEKAQKLGEGVLFEKVSRVKESEKLGYVAVYSFKDINLVRLSMNTTPDGVEKPTPPGGPAMEESEEADESEQTVESDKDGESEEAAEKDEDQTKVAANQEEKRNHFQFHFDKKTKNLTIRMPDRKDSDQKKKKKKEAKKEDKKPIPPMMKKLFEDMEVAYYVEIENGIKKTNASYVTDNKKVTLMQVNFGKIMDNQEAFEELQEREDDPEVFQELAKKIPGLKVEVKEEIQIQMK